METALSARSRYAATGWASGRIRRNFHQRPLSEPARSGVQRFAMEVGKAIDALIASGEYAALDGRIEILAPPTAREFPLRHIPRAPLRYRQRLFLGTDAVAALHAPAGCCSICACSARCSYEIRSWSCTMPRCARCRRIFRAVSRRLRFSDPAALPAGVSRRSLRCRSSRGARSANGTASMSPNMPVCYLGGDHVAAVPADYGIIDRLGLAERKFFLGVGISKNKNVGTIDRAHFEMRPGRYAAGADRPCATCMDRRRAARQLGMEGIRNAGYVSDAELRALYEHALASVCPSHYEGFGLPPVEAMAVRLSGDHQQSVRPWSKICGDAAMQCSSERCRRIGSSDASCCTTTEKRWAAMIAAGNARASSASHGIRPRAYCSTSAPRSRHGAGAQCRGDD